MTGITIINILIALVSIVAAVLSYRFMKKAKKTGFDPSRHTLPEFFDEGIVIKNYKNQAVYRSRKPLSE